MLFPAARPRNTSGCRTFPGCAVTKCLTIQFTRTVKILQTQTPKCRISTTHLVLPQSMLKITVLQGQTLKKHSCGGIQSGGSLGTDFYKYADERALKFSGHLQTENSTILLRETSRDSENQLFVGKIL